MRVPRWLWIGFLPILGAIAADRLHIENRLSSVEEFKSEIIMRLDRIEKKVDRLHDAR